MLCAAEAASARGRRLWDRAEALRGAALAARSREEDEVVAQLTRDRQLVLRAFTLLLRRVRATSSAYPADPALTCVHFTAGSIPSSGNKTGAEGIGVTRRRCVRARWRCRNRRRALGVATAAARQCLRAMRWKPPVALSAASTALTHASTCRDAQAQCGGGDLRRRRSKTASGDSPLA